jgi:hypothetical protein
VNKTEIDDKNILTNRFFTLSAHSSILSAHSNTLSFDKDNLSSHSSILSSHSSILSSHSSILSSHSSILSSHSNTLSSHSNTLSSHSSILSSHSSNLSSFTLWRGWERVENRFYSKLRTHFCVIILEYLVKYYGKLIIQPPSYRQLHVVGFLLFHRYRSRRGVDRDSKEFSSHQEGLSF